LVSKGNKHREKNKIDTPSKKELSIEDIIPTIVKKVVETLKPDMDKQLTAVNTQLEANLKIIEEKLGNQITTEIKDVRTQLPSPPTAQTNDETPPTNYTVPPTNNPSIPIEQPQSNIAGQILPLLMQAIRPQDSTSELMKMFLQTQMRNSMSKTTYADWFQEEMMKKMAKDYLNTSVPDNVQKSSDHFMKPIRDIGVRADQAKQQSENKQ